LRKFLARETTFLVESKPLMNVLRRGELFLISSVALDEPVDGEISCSVRAACRTIAKWAESYLCNGHPELGREGPVCPFTRPSLSKGLFWLTVRNETDLLGPESVVRIEEYLDWFLELEPKSGPESILKTILIVYPNIPEGLAASSLEPLQKLLKPKFVNRGIMVGQFYAGCQESGLWNDSFRALESPIPLLAIRNMVPSDFPFLHGRRGNPGMLLAYLNKFGTKIPTEVKSVLVDALQTYNLNLASRRPKRDAPSSR
jgi:Domain of unknown function (DUF6875)